MKVGVCSHKTIEVVLPETVPFLGVNPALGRQCIAAARG